MAANSSSQPTTWSLFLQASLADQKAKLVFVPPENNVPAKSVKDKDKDIDWTRAFAGIPPPRMIPFESGVLQPKEWEQAFCPSSNSSIEVLPGSIWEGVDSLLPPV
ncbi:hypothetical protein BCR33DRAFT_779718 [Rhizoclosmatium globosum]|uniref:Uncharacterized protein n=1 Tax=Rhizoclosmatium globosum TaxID=329046 RepID=A0A1Y2CZF8_9FUNG|nr:hypothetical protein BCR33DRAFT_779718 [Rhizoclosmatium globosum]|eukprot:ORY52409.1 hypothetical protein BCR33DRAFT_779718 [Rhizoclosmatium globosum]